MLFPQREHHHHGCNLFLSQCSLHTSFATRHCHLNRVYFVGLIACASIVLLLFIHRAIFYSDVNVHMSTDVHVKERSVADSNHCSYHLGSESYSPKLIMPPCIRHIPIYFTTGFSLCLSHKHINDIGGWIGGGSNFVADRCFIHCGST